MLKANDLLGSDDAQLHLKAVVNSQMGYLFSQQKLYKNAIDAFNEAFRCDSLLSDTTGIIYDLMEVGFSTITYQCPWLSTGGQTVYSSIFRKEQLREPLPAGKYYTGVLCTHHYKYPRTFDLKINFTVQ